jgi:probable F420-dependent oxidoreductase
MWSDGFMKVRIGVSLGPAATAEGLAVAVDLLESAGIDSLWLSEVVYGDLIEPLTGMTYALARTSHLKVGTGVAVLPGRNPAQVAKQLTSLAALAPGRVLPVFGLKAARPPEHAVFPVPGHRGAVFDESLRLLRTLVSAEHVSFHGQFFSIEDASIGPRPAKPLDIWLGGSAPGALRRVGELGDGWLASFLTPAEAAQGRAQIQAAAAAAGREVDPEHFGISLAVGKLTKETLRAVERRRPGIDPTAFAPPDWAAARRMIEQYVAAGLSKFVVRPTALSADSDAMDVFIGEFAAELMPLQS